MRRHVALALVLALAASGCSFLEEQFTETIREVKEEKGIDLNSPAQVAVASAFAGEEEGEQLSAAKTVQRLVNEQRGDDKAAVDDWSGARAAYERALDWTSVNDKRNKAAIREKLASTWIEESGRAGGPATSAMVGGLRNAAGTFGSLAGDAGDAATRSRLLYKKAASELNGGFGDHCVTLRQALQADPSNGAATYLLGRDCGGR